MYDHGDLVMRAVRNAGLHSMEKTYRWVHVKHVFAVGSTVATELCRKFGVDPDEVVGGCFDCQERQEREEREEENDFA